MPSVPPGRMRWRPVWAFFSWGGVSPINARAETDSMEPVRRNFTLGILHESLWGTAQGFIAPLTILPLAAHDLGRSVADTGLLEASLFAGMNAVQLGAAYFFPPSWTSPSRTAWMHAPALLCTLAASIVLALNLESGTRWALLMALITAHWVCLGLVVPHWAALSARNIPTALLGRYFGWCFSLSGLGAIFSAVVAARWASIGGLRWGYAACFGAAFAVQTASVLILSRTRPLQAEPEPAPAFPGFLKESWNRFRSEAGFPAMAVLVILLQIASASTQLMTAFLKDQGARTSDFIWFNPALAAGATLGSVSLGWLLDRKGPRVALVMGILPLIATLGFLTVGSGRGAGTAAFFGAGLFTMVFGSVLLPWVLRLAGPGRQILFMGLYSTATAPWNFLAPWALGETAGRWGFTPAFSVSAFAAVAALALVAGNGFWKATGSRSQGKI